MAYSTGMGAFGGISFDWDILGPGVAILLTALLCYLAGRIHQFYRTGEERDLAYRDGYNTATRSLFSLAARTARGVQAPPMLERPRPSPKPFKATASVVRARHAANGGPSTLQQTKQYTAWEKVHGVEV